MIGKCHWCEDELGTWVPNLGYACYSCFRLSRPNNVIFKLLRDFIPTWWVMQDARTWQRAAIEEQALLEIGFSEYVRKLLETDE